MHAPREGYDELSGWFFSEEQRLRGRQGEDSLVYPTQSRRGY
jgi:hypothetical protein